MTFINPQIPKISTNPRQEKHKGNRITIHHNQIADKDKGKTAKQPGVAGAGGMLHTEEQNLQSFWRSR